jgi:uncharacterized RDD family membrane protein YckC
MIARQISFFAPAAVMSAWATVMLHTFETGHINRLLSPMFRDNVLVAALLLIVLSALYVLLFQPATVAAPVLEPRDELSHFGRWLVLLIPVIAAAVLLPQVPTVHYQLPTPGITPMPTRPEEVNKVRRAFEDNQYEPVPVSAVNSKV